MSRDLLVEIGTEELPPGSLDQLRQAFADQLSTRLRETRLQFESLDSFATPRRLSLLVHALSEAQPDEDVEVLGPPVSAGFNERGDPQPAALGFAKRCGCSLDELEQKHTDKGPRLAYVEHRPGEQTIDLLPDLIEAALKQLPVARWMRWGASRIEFVRPVHWVVCLFGNQSVEAPVLGLLPTTISRGHRFLAGDVSITSPADYQRLLRDQGKVIVDSSERRAVIRFGVEKLARELGGFARIDEDLLDEVTALVEFPVPMSGSFDAEFLDVPQEALISSMQAHQRYFPVVDDRGQLLPHFIFVANIESPSPELIVQGNERVIRPRLADARFFYEQDRRKSLESFLPKLQAILYQKQLGSLYDKSQRIADLSAVLGGQMGVDPKLAHRAGMLSKCDLASEMVLEFDDLQGIMGRYYALQSGESPEVAEAILEHYLPRHAGDQLPGSRIGVCVGLADRLDTLTGIFGIGLTPSGSKDPFGLRRASLALLRLLIENDLHFSLRDMIGRATRAHQGLTRTAEETETLVFTYLLDRLPAYLQDRGIGVDVLRSVLQLSLDDVSDMVSRASAVQAFTQNDACSALAAANKRVSNLLEKSADLELPAMGPGLLEEAAEKKLANALMEVQARVAPLLKAKDYQGALLAMAALRSAVDQMFDDVMIMVENPALRANRLALLRDLRQLFLEVADISELPSESG